MSFIKNRYSRALRTNRPKSPTRWGTGFRGGATAPTTITLTRPFRAEARRDDQFTGKRFSTTVSLVWKKRSRECGTENSRAEWRVN